MEGSGTNQPSPPAELKGPQGKGVQREQRKNVQKELLFPVDYVGCSEGPEVWSQGLGFSLEDTDPLSHSEKKL